MASSTKSKIANPGYSFKAPKWNWWKFRYEGGGVVWMGSIGGDTPQNRQKFIDWYLHNMPGANVDSIVFID